MVDEYKACIDSYFRISMFIFVEYYAVYLWVKWVFLLCSGRTGSVLQVRYRYKSMQSIAINLKLPGSLGGEPAVRWERAGSAATEGEERGIWFEQVAKAWFWHLFSKDFYAIQITCSKCCVAEYIGEYLKMSLPERGIWQSDGLSAFFGSK